MARIKAFRPFRLAKSSGSVRQANHLSITVDKLGRLKARIAKLLDQEDLLKAILIASGKKSAEGKLFRASIAKYLQSRLNQGAVEKKLGRAWIRRHSTKSRCIKVNVVSKRTSKARA